MFEPTPEDDGSARQATLTVGALARRLGVAPATLRTWDRRYGLGPSEHRAGSNRRYQPDDVARLEVMRRLTRDGVLPAEAARVARASTLDAEGLAPVVALSPKGPVGSARTQREQLRGLLRAATTLDSTSVRDLVQRSLLTRGVTATWDALLVPALTAVGDRWESTGAGVEVEHLLSESILEALRSTISGPVQAINARPVLLASAEGELHALPLHAMAAALAERQVAVRLLGARVPREALVAAVRRSGPAAVFVWAQVPATGRTGELDELLTVRPAPAVLLGGGGWSDPIPAPAARVHDLSEAVTSVLRAVGG